jgi:hypothetical protein
LADRHVYRDPALRPRIDAINLMTVELAGEFMALGWGRAAGVPELIFSLMPLRHSATVPR